MTAVLEAVEKNRQILRGAGLDKKVADCPCPSCGVLMLCARVAGVPLALGENCGLSDEERKKVEELLVD